MIRFLKSSPLRHTLELLVILLAFGIYASVIVDSCTPAFNASTVMPLVIIVLLARFARSKVLFAVQAILVLLAVAGWIYISEVRPVVNEIRRDDTFGILRDRYLLSSHFQVVRIWAVLVASFLAGCYATRSRFALWKVFLGSLAGTVLINFLLTPFTFDSTVPPLVAPAILTTVILALPLQRAALQRLGIAGPPIDSADRTPFAYYLFLLLLLALVPFSAVVSFVERESMEALVLGPRPTWESPARRDASTPLRRYFTRTAEEKNSLRFPAIPTYGQAGLYLDHPTSAAREAAWQQVDKAIFRDYDRRIREVTNDFETASRSDYLGHQEGHYLSYLAIREVSRHLLIRAEIAWRDGRPLDAVHDIETVLKFGGLLGDHHHLVGQMIGSAVRSMGIETGYRLLLYNPADEQTLMALSDALARSALAARTGVDWHALSRGEPAFMSPIVANIESIVPAFVRAGSNALADWANFDLLQLATNIELYRLKTGAYPLELRELAPAFMPRVPLDPRDGKDYRFTRPTTSTYTLQWSSSPPETGRGHKTPLKFPPLP